MSQPNLFKQTILIIFMVRMDIVAGLKNAVERGYSLEVAKQTLRNSGYNEQEIQEASNYLTGGQINTQQVQSYQAESQETQQSQIQQPPKIDKKKFPFLLLFLLLIFLVLVSFLVLSIIFKEELITLFRNLFG